MISLILALLCPILIGIVIVRLLIPNEKRLPVILLSVGVGYGVSSWLVFLWLLIFGRASRAYLLAEAVAIVLGALLLYRRRGAERSQAPPRETKPKWRVFSLETALVLGLVAVAGLAAARYVLATRMAPYGSFDAWESYNLKARFILLSGRDWKQLFTAVPDPVPDYPLFLPLSVAGVLMSMGRDSLAAPAGIAVLFICATAGLLLWTVGECRSRSQAALAGMVLLGTPFFVHLSFAQYADVPLAFFFLATMSLLFCYSRSPDYSNANSKGNNKDGGKDDADSDPKAVRKADGKDDAKANLKAGIRADGTNLLVLAGLIAGLSAWVKNEGLVFFVAISITYFLFSWRMDGRGDAVRRLRCFALGGAGPIVLALLFKLTFAGTNALVATQGRAGMLRKLLMPHRYAQVFEGFLYHLYHLASWPESVLLLLAIYAVLLGLRIHKRDRRPEAGIDTRQHGPGIEIDERERGTGIRTDERDREPGAGIERRARVALLTCAATLLITLAVYFVVLVGSPYDTPPFDVSWYILVTAPRLFMQLWPCFLLIFFLTVCTPDDIIGLLRQRRSSPM